MILLKFENNDTVVTDKTKMDELLKLLEELVINKIRIEKIKQSIKENDYKKVLDQEIQIVGKVQEIVKKIQTSQMKNIYKKLQDELVQNSKNKVEYDFTGAEAEFDNNLETHILKLLQSLLKIYEDLGNNYMSISAYNNSSSVVIEIVNSKNDTDESNQKNIFNREHVSLTYINEEELTDWLNKTSLTEYSNFFMDFKNLSLGINAVVELQSDKNKFSKVIITIPYSSSITKAQFIKLGNQTFAIPVEYIEKIVNINNAEIVKSNGRDFIKYMDHIISIILIDKKLDMVIEEDYVSFVVLEYNDQMKVLPVNSIFEQSDIVVRPKPQAISEISEYKGMAILDDGNVTIVIDVPSLFQADA